MVSPSLSYLAARRDRARARIKPSRCENLDGGLTSESFVLRGELYSRASLLVKKKIELIWHYGPSREKLRPEFGGKMFSGQRLEAELNLFRLSNLPSSITDSIGWVGQFVFFMLRLDIFPNRNILGP